MPIAPPTDPGGDEPRPPSEYEIALSYVEQQLYKLGFTVEQCAVLAESGADWHRAETLLLNDCPHHLVVDILA